MDEIGSFQNERLTERDFKRLSRFIEENYGIRMPVEKQVLLESRLNKRLRVLNFKTFKQYCDFLFSDEGMATELVKMIDAVTTNKTEFFRESGHFDFLINTGLPNLYFYKEKRMINIWSTASSTGEEPYTLAMVLEQFKEQYQDVNFQILATDISEEVLDSARKAVYTEENASAIPLEYKKKYLLRSKNPGTKQVRIKPQLRAKTHFMRINLMADRLPVKGSFEIIFCRNVLIYFNKENQRKLLSNLYSSLIPGGYLFLGHSESLAANFLSMNTVASTVYQKREGG